MKCLLLFLGFVAVTVSYKLSNDRQKRFLVGYCDVNEDCGEDRCCSPIGTCHNKRGLGQSCNFNSLFGCSECQSGLSCQPVYQIGSVDVWHRCQPVPTEELGSGGGP